MTQAPEGVVFDLTRNSFDVRTQLLLHHTPIHLLGILLIIIIVIITLGWLIRSTTLQHHDTGVYEAGITTS